LLDCALRKNGGQITQVSNLRVDLGCLGAGVRRRR